MGDSGANRTKRRQCRTERGWQSWRLAVHRDISMSRWQSWRLAVHRDISMSQRAARREHFHNKIHDCSTSKQLHAVSDQLAAKTKVSILPVPSEKLPDAFCEFFADKIPKIRRDLDCFQAEDVFKQFSGVEFIAFESVSEETVRRLVMKSPCKSCSFDPIPTEFVKSTIDALLPVITLIVNNSLRSGTVDDSLSRP